MAKGGLMFIRHFEVSNYMIHKATSVDLHPVTVFVGSNNGGKSALFDSLLNFSMVSRGKLSQAFGPGPYSYMSIRHHGASRAARIRFKVVLAMAPESDSALHYTISYAEKRGDWQAYVIYEEKLEDADSGVVFFDRADSEASAMPGVVDYLGDDRSLFAAIRRAQVEGDYREIEPLISHVAKEISRLNKFRLVPSNLARPSRLPDTSTDEPEPTRAPRLDYNGDELAGVLYYLAEIASPVLDEIVERLHPVLTGFEGFEFNTVGTDRIGFSVRFGDTRGVVPAANLSDGTLSLIGMLVLLLSPSRPPILFLEEPENGLTPRSTRAIYEAVVTASSPTAKPRSQILLSSHSPFVIVQAWNGEERDFIYQVKAIEGSAVVRPFKEILDTEGVHLRKKHGERRELGLQMADNVMDGYYS
jgi:predicted ATPase